MHSGFFHATMLAVGVATLVKLYRPNKAMDGLKYMVLVSIISVLAIMVNETTQSVGIPGNLMFYHSAPQEIHFLKVISDTSLAL
ncbi:MAG: hypothetical protein MJ233_01125 [Mycoplasmoidaceae bacterium]|nr:hypothetical protein [Mycoplasmoidaceae bacterium]